MGNVDQLLFAHNKIIIVDNKTASIFFFDDVKSGNVLYTAMQLCWANPEVAWT